MSVPAAKVRTFKSAAQTAGPTVGVDDFAAAVPLFEPISAGPPPVRPMLVRRVRPGEYPVRRLRSSAGYGHTAALGTSGRAAFSVEWPGLTPSERDAVLEFLRDQVRVGDAGGELGFEIEPDGPGNGTVVVRPLGPAAFSMSGSGARTLHSVDAGVCEELIT